jgi:hypothetical protein
VSSNLAVALQTLVSHFIHGLTQVRHHVERCFYEDEDDGDEDGDDDDDDDEDGDDDDDDDDDDCDDDDDEDGDDDDDDNDDQGRNAELCVSPHIQSAQQQQLLSVE